VSVVLTLLVLCTLPCSCLQLHGLAATAATTSALMSGLACNLTGALDVDSVMRCTGSYVFDQAAFEAGTRAFTAAFTSANITSEVASNAVTTTPVEVPAVSVAIQLATCTTPADAGVSSSTCIQGTAVVPGKPCANRPTCLLAVCALQGVMLCAG
jgi:hypothetical protein